MIIISRYSGKCDLADWMGDYSDERLKQSKIYLYDNFIVPLKIESQKDLAPYYPYIVGVGMGSKDGGSVIHLSKESFIDSEEKEHLGWKLRDFQKYRRKCKREKKPYDVEEAIKKVCWFVPSENDRKIAEIVGERGDKVTVEDLVEEYGIHDSVHEHFRNELLKKMIELGWEENKAKWWIWKDWKVLKKEEEVVPDAE